MALSQKHRSTIYHQLAPIIGDEEAEALLSQFPSRDLDEPVTKEFVRAEMSDVRAEFAVVRAEFAVVRAEISDVRAELRGEIADLRAEMHAGFATIQDRFRQQTIWIASVVAVATGVAAGLGRL